ncbi:DUF6678 family protein [Pseudomonas sp. RIT-To-2]|uniref:DUF6678 family protein n=1 Tax=Pseudomonas sp. RIT-To-2 TaxID=3462541 RepID=UPI002412E814
MSELPHAGAGHNETMRRKIRAAVVARNLTSAANNTKWNELIDHFRARDRWTPSYRYRSVSGYVSHWDVEWFGHLPYPFACVEWFDIGLYEAAPLKGILLPREFIDHTDEIVSAVASIGLEFEVRGDVLRIWGYLPKSHDHFPLPEPAR